MNFNFIIASLDSIQIGYYVQFINNKNLYYVYDIDDGYVLVSDDTGDYYQSIEIIERVYKL